MQKLILTEEIIDCFKKCIQYNDFCRILCDNSQLYFDYLENWDKTMWNDRFQRVAPEMHEDLRNAMLDQNFDSFYLKYRSDADYIIERAKRQRIMDFQIERGSNVHESFAFRDFAANIEIQNSESIIEEILKKKVIGNCKIEKLECLEKKFEAGITSLKIHVDRKLNLLKTDQEERNREMEMKIIEMEARLMSTLDEKLSEQRQLFDQTLKLLRNEHLEEVEKVLQKLKSGSENNQENIMDLQKQFKNKLEKNELSMLLIVGVLGEELNKKIEEIRGYSLKQEEKIKTIMLEVELLKMEMSSDSEEDEESVVQEAKLKIGELFDSFQKNLICEDSSPSNDGSLNTQMKHRGFVFKMNTNLEPDQSSATFDEEVEKEISEFREGIEQLVNNVSYRSVESNAGNIDESTKSESPSNPVDDDNEIDEMNKKFQQELDEQNRVQGQKLQAARQRRAEMNVCEWNKLIQYNIFFQRKTGEDLKTATKLARGNTKGA
uniref:Uncharacterized protein n=1 Tax=Caenorhabditis tropicalis TaxID=1561998 RepID=A0A1I7SYZ8_9PELO